LVQVPAGAWMVLGILGMMVFACLFIPMLFTAVYVKPFSWIAAGSCGSPGNILDPEGWFCHLAHSVDDKVDWLLGGLWRPVANHWLPASIFFSNALLVGKIFFEEGLAEKLFPSSAMPVLDEGVV